MFDVRYLELASRILGGAVAESYAVRGTYDGRDVMIRAVHGTVTIAVALAARDDLLLKIGERSWLTEEALEVYETVDVRTGDVAFDEAFHIEGAPSDVVIASLTADVRAHLLAFPQCSVELGREGLVERHRTPELANLEPCVRAVIAFARSIEHARDEIPKLRALPTQADGFRGNPELALAKSDQAELELARLAAMQSWRGEVIVPFSLASAAIAWIATVLWTGLPLVFLLLALPVGLFGGLVLMFVLSGIGRFTGITSAVGRARIQALTDASAARAAARSGPRPPS